LWLLSHVVNQIILEKFTAQQILVNFDADTAGLLKYYTAFSKALQETGCCYKVFHFLQVLKFRFGKWLHNVSAQSRSFLHRCKLCLWHSKFFL